MSPIQLNLQPFGDAVGGFVIVSDPFSPFGVLNGHSSHTCVEEGEIDTQALQLPDTTLLSLGLTCNCRSQFLHQLDSSLHCAPSLYPLVYQQDPHTCRRKRKMTSSQARALHRLINTRGRCVEPTSKR